MWRRRCNVLLWLVVLILHEEYYFAFFLSSLPVSFVSAGSPRGQAMLALVLIELDHKENGQFGTAALEYDFPITYTYRFNLKLSVGTGSRDQNFYCQGRRSSSCVQEDRCCACKCQWLSAIYPHVSIGFLNITHRFNIPRQLHRSGTYSVWTHHFVLFHRLLGVLAEHGAHPRPVDAAVDDGQGDVHALWAELARQRLPEGSLGEHSGGEGAEFGGAAEGGGCAGDEEGWRVYRGGGDGGLEEGEGLLGEEVEAAAGCQGW